MPVANPALTPRRMRTRERLLDAATEVFAERGFHGASVEDICDRAEFTRGAFYSNFVSKDELVLEIAARYSARLLEGIARLADRDDLTPTEIVEAVLDEWTSNRAEREKWFLLQSELTLHAVRDRVAGRAWLRQQARVRSSLARLIDDICARRELQLSVTAEEIARLAMTLFLAEAGQHLLEPRAVRDGQLALMFLPVVIDAVVRPTGP